MSAALAWSGASRSDEAPDDDAERSCLGAVVERRVARKRVASATTPYAPRCTANPRRASCEHGAHIVWLGRRFQLARSLGAAQGTPSCRSCRLASRGRCATVSTRGGLNGVLDRRLVVRGPWSRSCLNESLRHWHRSIRSQQATLDLLAAQPSIPRDRGCSVSHVLQEELVLILVLVVLLLLFGGGGYYVGPGVGYYGGGGISLVLLIVILYLLFRGDRTGV
jgi:hypothetical protein